jgi:hypothetical protein
MPSSFASCAKAADDSNNTAMTENPARINRPFMLALTIVAYTPFDLFQPEGYSLRRITIGELIIGETGSTIHPPFVCVNRILSSQ